MKTLIRKTYVMLVVDNDQKKYLNGLMSSIYKRAASIMTHLLSWKKVGPNGYQHSLGGEILPLETASDEELDVLYQHIIDNDNSARIIRGPFALPPGKCKTGMKSEKDLEQKLRKLLDEGKLPLNLGEWEGTPGNDFVAFKIAVSSLKSWDDRNKVTEANYAKALEELNKNTPDEAGIKALNEWLDSNKLFLTKKVASKFKKFGWDTRIANYPWEILRTVNSDASYWAKMFTWQVAKQRVFGLRPTSLCTLPELAVSEREIPYGVNYENFSLELAGDRLKFVLGKREFQALRTLYFKDLKVIPAKNSYVFKYRRGNNSTLDEQVEAVLKEITLYRKNGNYYVGLSLNLQVDGDNKNCRTVKDYYFFKRASLPNGARIMAIDLGITNPASYVHVSTKKKGHEVIGSGIIGVDKEFNFLHPKYVAKLKKFKASLSEAFAAITELHPIKKVLHSQEEWSKLRYPISQMIEKLSKEMRQLRRGDLNVRNHGTSHEQMQFILVYKNFVDLLKKWTYFGSKPAAKKERRKGFEKHIRRLENLKKDFRKKLACEIVREARRKGSDLIVIEDLEHFTPDSTKDSNLNELLMLWGSGQIGKWIEHFADQYNIGVLKVDPRMTSQIDPLTGKIGYRSKYDKRKFFVKRGNKIEVIHADLAAAENIAKRVTNRMLPFVKAEKTQDGYVAWCSDDDNSRRRHVLDLTFGSHKILFRDGQPEVLEEKPSVGEEVYLYRMDDGWWPGEVKYAYLQQLAKQCEGGSRQTANGQNVA